VTDINHTVLTFGGCGILCFSMIFVIEGLTLTVCWSAFFDARGVWLLALA